MVTRRDYTAEGVAAARSVLVELVHLLGEYKDEGLGHGCCSGLCVMISLFVSLVESHPALQYIAYRYIIPEFCTQSGGD